GQEQRGYVNKPGIDTQDLWRTFYGAVPYIAGGGAIAAATKGAPLALQAVTQAAGAGATSVAGDLAQEPLGSEQGIEADKALFMAAAGGAGPVLGAGGSALWRKLITEPRLFNKTTGKLTEKGAEAARQAG